jgi:hypothetical protein
MHLLNLSGKREPRRLAEFEPYNSCKVGRCYGFAVTVAIPEAEFIGDMFGTACFRGTVLICQSATATASDEPNSMVQARAANDTYPPL